MILFINAVFILRRFFTVKYHKKIEFNKNKLSNRKLIEREAVFHFYGNIRSDKYNRYLVIRRAVILRTRRMGGLLLRSIFIVGTIDDYLDRSWIKYTVVTQKSRSSEFTHRSIDRG